MGQGAANQEVTGLGGPSHVWGSTARLKEPPTHMIASVSEPI
jgi:hypothetical protein